MTNLLMFQPVEASNERVGKREGLSWVGRSEGWCVEFRCTDKQIHVFINIILWRKNWFINVDVERGD
jgi:hypothetical protein